MTRVVIKPSNQRMIMHEDCNTAVADQTKPCDCNLRTYDYTMLKFIIYVILSTANCIVDVVRSWLHGLAKMVYLHKPSFHAAVGTASVWEVEETALFIANSKVITFYLQKCSNLFEAK